MGNASSHPPTDTQEILIHSFQLDADFDTCQLPCCRRRNAMFHPSNLGPNTQHFLPLEEANNILKDLNLILHETSFNPRPTNPCFLLTILATFVVIPIVPLVTISPINFDETTDERLEREKHEEASWDLPLGVKLPLILFFGLGLPWIIYFSMLVFYRKSRRNRLTGYIEEWNREKSGQGVKLSFGGGGTTPQGVVVGSEFGGTYENFFMATWDPKGLLFKGYLHVFVNVQERQEWCRNNRKQFVAPTPRGQVQSIVPTGGYVPPPGYALVPLAEQPQGYQPPPGYALQRIPV